MLDAYIIDRIRRERERQQQEDKRLPLHIERHPDDDVTPANRRDPGEEPERGSTVIDFHV